MTALCNRNFTTLLILAVVCSRETLQQNVSPIVKTSLGQIQGLIMQSQRGRDFYAFRGVRYAKPPVGKLRFAAPEPVESWTETLQAFNDSLMCPQINPYFDYLTKDMMSEDCLALNVYSRNLSASKPVLIYIHGGSNIYGAGHSLYESGPHYLMDRDIVLVTLSYRLGAFGFLTTRSDEAPGNYAYHDQILAFKWVRDHIKHFGGDSNLVTLCGESAGSHAVTLHMASPLSKGLFHRAIAMSGSTTSHWELNNLVWTQRLARDVSCPLYNPKNVVDCLRTVDWQIIVDVCGNWEYNKLPKIRWSYEIDGHFLHAHPTTIFAEQKFHKVPLLAGMTRDELIPFFYGWEDNVGLLDDISLNFDLYVPPLVQYNGSADHSIPSKSQHLRNFYLGNEANVTKSNIESFGTLASDGIISHSVHRLVQLATRKMPVFYYRLDYVGQSTAWQTGAHGIGIGHADDLQYLFTGIYRGPRITLDSPDMVMVDLMTSWWGNFTHYGAPYENYAGIWEPSRKGKIVTSYLNRNTSTGPEPFQDRFALWDGLFPIGKSYGELLRP